MYIYLSIYIYIYIARGVNFGDVADMDDVAFRHFTLAQFRELERKVTIIL